MDQPASNVKTVRISCDVQRIEIDFAVPRVIRVIPVNNARATGKEYIIKVTPRGGVTLV